MILKNVIKIAVNTFSQYIPYIKVTQNSKCFTRDCIISKLLIMKPYIGGGNCSKDDVSTLRVRANYYQAGPRGSHYGIANQPPALVDRSYRS